MKKYFHNIPLAGGHDGCRIVPGRWLKSKKTIPIYNRDVLLAFHLLALDFYQKQMEIKAAKLIEVLK